MTDQNPYQSPDSEPVVEVEKHKFPLFSTLLDVFIAPNKAMKNVVRSAYGWWFALLLVVISVSTVSYYYPASMTAGEFVEMQIEQIEASGQEVTSQEVEILQMSAPFMKIGMLVGGLTWTLVVLLSLTLLYWLSSMILSEERPRFGQAFNLAAWGSLPIVVSSIVSTINIALANGPLSQSAFDPTVISQLLALPLDSFTGAWLALVSLFTIWTWAIKFIGFRELTSCGPLGASVVTVIIPLATYAAIASLQIIL